MERLPDKMRCATCNGPPACPRPSARGIAARVRLHLGDPRGIDDSGALVAIFLAAGLAPGGATLLGRFVCAPRAGRMLTATPLLG